MAFSTRHVATEAGAKFFGMPIGSVITEGVQTAADGRNKPVTKLRLQSLQRQFIQAKRTSNQPLMAQVNKQFKKELAVYMDITGVSAHEILDDLDANQDKGFNESTELNDKDTADGNKVETSGDDSEGGDSAPAAPSGP